MKVLEISRPDCEITFELSVLDKDYEFYAVARNPITGDACSSWRFTSESLEDVKEQAGAICEDLRNEYESDCSRNNTDNVVWLPRKILG